MRCVLIATAFEVPEDPTGDRYPRALLPLIDEPFVHMLVESLVGQGVTEIDFVLSHAPEVFEAHCGSGERWGVTFRYHLVRDPTIPTDLLRGGRLLLGHADCLPRVAFFHHRPDGEQDETVLYVTGGEGPSWTGWAWLSPASTSGLPRRIRPRDLGSRLSGSRMEVTRILDMSTWQGVLDAHRSVFDDRLDGLIVRGQERSEGIWLSRNVRIHPSATLTAPVFVGRNTRVGEGAQIGPNASIGRDCVIDRDCTVRDSVVFPGSYLGENLELRDVLVDRHRLIHPSLGTDVPIRDKSIIGSLQDRSFRRNVRGTVSQGIALLMLIPLWPLLLGTALYLAFARKGRVWHGREAVRLPALPDETTWETYTLWSFSPRRARRETYVHGGVPLLEGFVMHLLPGLLNVLRRDLSIVGVPPRSREEIRQLPGDWKSLYLATKGGLLTELLLHTEERVTTDTIRASEIFYAVQTGWRHDWRILWGYLGRLIGSLPVALERPWARSPRKGG